MGPDLDSSLLVESYKNIVIESISVFQMEWGLTWNCPVSGFVWLLTFVAVHGKNQVGLDVVIDPHCSQVKNESAIIINKAIKELEARQEVAVTYYCNEGCFQNYHVDECKNSQNASTPTFKLVLNV